MNKVVTGLPDLKINHEGICKGCAKGKNIKNPFPKSETKTKGTLELIHSDVCGPMSSTSLSGFEYYTILYYIYWWLFKKNMDILLEGKEQSVWKIQGNSNTW